MPTNEAGLSQGHDQGAGGGITASDMPAGEQNADAQDQSGGAEAQTTDAVGVNEGEAQAEDLDD
jgi:hypothetical protein